ncbi:hypothetical protein RJ641_019154 [Dillenia turbinata]|uniref:Uncharacterized protein n=1 Tax=Dillenia turbinata TaxID=194707 RepID=A0AAN8Z0J1_9MAGN
MASSLQIIKSNLSPLSSCSSRSYYNYEGFNLKKVCLKLKFQSRRRRRVVAVRRDFRVCCSVQEGDNQSNGEEPPESLFMKELRRRGMTPTSLLEESNRGTLGLDDEIKSIEDDGSFSKANFVSTDVQKSLANQRERSMALNSEGLEGLIPRAKLLLTIGGTFFLGFGPLIVITVAFFSALYVYFGPNFVHDASNMPVTLPQYIDPFQLLEDERISEIAPRVN